MHPLRIYLGRTYSPTETFAHERTRAVIVLHDSLFFSERRRIVTLAAAGRLPTIWTTREFAEDGGLITYGLD